jgi:hypothetical protein
MKLLASFLLLFVLSALCHAELIDENFVVKQPKGFKVDFRSKKDNMILTEMVPVTESVQNWTQMVTMQTHLGMKNVTPEQFQGNMATLWAASCKDSSMQAIAKGMENGYPFSVWGYSCPLNPATGKPETMFLKVIQGNDSLYGVQVAFRSIPKSNKAAMEYLKTALVCDTRKPEHPCPKLSPSNTAPPAARPPSSNSI